MSRLGPVDADETLICMYLKTCRGQFVSGREVSKRAGNRKRFRKDPEWALPILKRLVMKRVLESDPAGHYRYIPQREKDRKKRWLSPQIEKILKNSGKTFEVVSPEEDSGSLEQHYRD